MCCWNLQKAMGSPLHSQRKRPRLNGLPRLVEAMQHEDLRLHGTTFALRLQPRAQSAEEQLELGLALVQRRERPHADDSS